MGDTVNEKLRIKKAKIVYGALVRWARTKAASMDGDQIDDEDGKLDKANYTSRRIRYTGCCEEQETKTVQLHTAQGFRDLHCRACGKHERCLYNLC